MAKKARKIPTGSNRELAPEGTHNAVCISVIELGTQKTTFQGKEKEQHQIQMAFQLVDEETTEGNAVVVYKTFTYIFSEKSNLTKTLKAWLKVSDDEFDVEECLGKPCLVTITHTENEAKGKTYDNVTAITALTKGTKIAKASEPLQSLFLDEGFEKESFDALPDWLKAKIMNSPQYKDIAAEEDAKGKKKPAAKAPAKKEPAKKAKK